MRTILNKMKRVLFVLLCLAVGLLIGLFLAERLVNLYVPQTDPLPRKNDSAAFDYR